MISGAMNLPNFEGNNCVGYIVTTSNLTKDARVYCDKIGIKNIERKSLINYLNHYELIKNDNAINLLTKIKSIDLSKPYVVEGEKLSNLVKQENIGVLNFLSAKGIDHEKQEELDRLKKREKKEKVQK
jgi:hypothetical protein